MTGIKKKILFSVLALLAIIQFFRPSKNVAEQLSEADISKTYPMPEAVHHILMKKCYDCHSNNTAYPWYSNIQPVGWWMAWHVRDGKKHLDFSDFKNYDAKRASHKLEETSEAVTEGWMPLSSYLWMHSQAKLDSSEVKSINAWIKSLNLIEVKH